MKKIIYIMALIIIQMTSAKSQNQRYINSTLKQEISGRKLLGETFHEVQLLNFKSDAKVENIGDYFVYEIDRLKLREVFKANYNSINFILPLKNGKKLEIFVTRNNIFTDGFEETVTNDEGIKKINTISGNLYHGIINEEGKVSFACISIFEDEISGVISDESGNWNLGKLSAMNTNDYAYFNDRNFKIPKVFTCGTPERKLNEIEKNPEPESMTAIKKCVKIFIDCDKSLYSFLGTTSAVKTYIVNLFNVSSTIYGNEDVSVTISGINYFTGTDQFSGSSSTASLNAYRSFKMLVSQAPPILGNVACLLAHDGGNGGIAFLSAICDNYSLSYCDIDANYTSSQLKFPTYTWDANVFTHELGHNFGSNHTHWCGWVGGAIDNCNQCWNPAISFEGNCTSAPNPPINGGTIMSYCHGCSTGVSLLAGFGIQPGDAIRSFIDGTSCLTNCSGNCLSYVSVGVPITSGNILNFEAEHITYGNNDINSGATVNFMAGDMVILNPGFRALTGSTFIAYIAGCTAVALPGGEEGRSTEGVFSENLIDVFPNPFSQTFKISLSQDVSNLVKIQIFNSLGKLIKEINTIGNVVEMDLNNFDPGVYFLDVKTNDKRVVRKIFKL